MLWWVIIGCEVGFWVLLGGGLAVRYFLKMRRLSSALLISVPLIDVVLLAFSIFDMRSGADGELRHALAAAYIGYSIMFGHRTIRWADERFAHRFADGPPPWKPPKRGMPRVRYEIMMFARCLGMYAIAWAVTGLLVWIVGDYERTEYLVLFMAGLVKVPIIWGVVAAFDIHSALKKREDEPVAESTRVPAP
ncbi:hypothetical protein [Stackebrandtia nassauensis]|uniref:Uncharacterized protein n=1 Tax=Stackebrandtia nassauensis (strain DSM 44728 / CIP 108903 / NRRL B-16338 / NBRC 102104 / LLR-40K-21) TaxID=446470 RepID=D3Q8N3_STANL|nr:hypothetical protein Snas_4834 [Stackebrandtia nassauensis DSM 44728]